MKIYVSSSFLNKIKAKQVMQQLRSAGHTITADWTKAPDGEKTLSILRKESAIDFLGTMDAEVVVVVPPGRLGTSTEMGIALGHGAHVFIVGMSRAERKTNVFFNHRRVIHVPNMHVLIAQLDILEHR